jgi:hypothetical protein
VRGAPKASGALRRRAPEPEPDARAPEVVRRGGVEVVFHPGPLPRLADEPLTKAELDFRWLIGGEPIGDRVEVRREHHEWGERVRRAWEGENVVWFHGYAAGKPVWRRERPPPDVEPPKGANRSNELPRCKLRTKTQEEGSHP